MPFIIADRVRETSTTVGTGNIALGGAVIGYQSFDAVMDTADTTYYVFADQAGGPNWEVGIGTFTAPSTLARTTIISSSNGGSIVNFTAGVKDVFIGLPASKTNVDDQPNFIEVNSSTAALRITQTGTGNALLVEDSANPDSSPFVIDASGNVGVGTTTPTAPLDVNGNVAITGTARRIIGTFGGGTLASRTAFQTSITNGNTGLLAIPNGTATNSNIRFFNTSNPDNASALLVGCNPTEAFLVSEFAGTGTFLPMTFTTGGSERMRIDTSGNVGIGTSSPTSRLTVAGGVSPVEIYQNSASIRFSSSPNRTNNYYLGANISDSVDAGFIIGYGTDIGTGTPRIIINSSGNVGVGGSPGADSRLRIEGAESRLRSVNTTSGAIAYFGAMSPNEARAWSVTSTDLTLGTSNTERMRISAAGGVGIGVSSPSYPLDIQADAAAFGWTIRGRSADNISVGRFATNANVDTARLIAFGDGSFAISNTSSATQRMVIDSAGNIRVGDASAAGTGGRFIDIYNLGADANSYAIMRLITQEVATSNASTVDIVKYKNGTFALNNNDTNAATCTTFGVAGSERMRITAAGNVGIGTSSPGARLDVRGSIDAASSATSRVRITMSGGVGSIVSENSGTQFEELRSTGQFASFYTGLFGATERMRIDASGNVGIGTTTPGVPLEVAGTIRTVAATPFYNLVSGSTDMGGIYSPDTSSVNILARSSKSLVFMSGGVAERMRIDASGNVGIGTSSPTGRLSVTNGDDARVKIFSNGGSVGVIDAVANTNDATGRWLSINPTGGNVGIGTTLPASHRLEVVSASGDCVGSLRSAASGAGIQRLIGSTNSFAAFNALISTDGATGQQHWYVGGNGTQNTLVFMTGGSNERARIGAAGDFSVGTTNSPGRITSVTTTNIGVYGASTVSHGVFGDGGSSGFYGVYGQSNNTSYGGTIGYHVSYNVFGILGYAGYGLYSNASIWVNGTVYTSDARLKENVAPLEGSLAKVAALNPVSFDWKANSFRGASSDFGLIAQEVEQVIPECVFETAVPQRTPEMKHAPTLEEELGTYKGVDYGRFIPLLIAAVKELSAENNTLKARVAALENR